MSKTIRGLSIEISADASKFNKEMRSVNGSLSNTDRELKALQDGLKLEFDSSKFVKAQQLAQQAIEDTESKAQILRERLKYLEETGVSNTSSEFQKLQVQIEQTDTKVLKLKNQLQDINQLKFQAVGNQIKDIGDNITKAGQALAPLSAAAAGALAGFGALGAKAITTGANIDDLSKRFGVSAEKIQEWQYIAMQTGVDVDVFNKALIKMRAAMLDMSSGKINEQSKAIQALGLSMDKFANSEEMFDGIIAALSGMNDATLQASYANEIFGDKIANELLPFLQAGKDEIEGLKEEFGAFSILSSEQAEKLGELDDKFNRIKESIKYMALQIGASLMPLIQKLADSVETVVIPKISALTEWFSDLTLGQQEFAAKVLIVIAALAPVALIIGKITSAIGGFIGILPNLQAGLSKLAAHPIIAIIGVIAILIGVLYTTNEKFRESINNLLGTLTSALAPVFELLVGLLNQVFALLMPIIDMLGNMLADAVTILLNSLAPLLNQFQLFIDLLSPLLPVLLIPIKMMLMQFIIPLKLIGALLGFLAPVFEWFGETVNWVFSKIPEVISPVIKFLENAINGVINLINGLIDGVNKVSSLIGVTIPRLNNIKLDIGTPNKTSTISGGGTESDELINNDINNISDIYGSGNITNYDNSTKTQNVTVVINNYSSDLDYDDILQKINMKLAENF